ncbi:LysR family transcriptional regulator [Clostridium sp. Marseille-P2415]|uniref:LysR family transcriptional regulator n=1 Tax=Clostridium sp. Marseille-P2415 TaxID=1805471 RepID=UPI000988442D|nr:LysR family transcriptional regulator [Clostridium sp. Marseille-P2415]
MTNRELQYVKTVADEKSISQAAKKLFIAQPSLSQSLQRIEDSLGIKLFIRTKNGLNLTYAGERYYQIACQILKIYDDFETEISDINNLRTGRIFMGVTNHLGTIMLPRILPEFRKMCPAIEINVYEETTDRQEERLLSGELDFALLHAPKKDSHPSLHYELLARDPFVIALPQGNPLIEKAQTREGYNYPVLDIKLLKNEPFIVLHKRQRIRHVMDAILAKAKIVPDIVLTLKNYETAQSLAGKGLGITLLPSDYANITSMETPPVLLSIDEKYSPNWNLCITTLQGGFLSRADEYFLSLVRKYFTR